MYFSSPFVKFFRKIRHLQLYLENQTVCIGMPGNNIGGEGLAFTQQTADTQT